MKTGKVNKKKRRQPRFALKIGKVNRNHPELRRGEVFLTNASDSHFPTLMFSFTGRPTVDDRSSWECIGWRTKRRGRVAYTTDNKPIPGMFPVFVRRSELKRAGIDPDKLWNRRALG